MVSQQGSYIVQYGTMLMHVLYSTKT